MITSIVSLGYLGLSLMRRFNEVGYKVLGFDIDQSKVDALNGGQSHIEHISGDSIANARVAGFVPYYPGPGLGGHGIPINPFYLTWKAREYGVHTRFIELAGEVNSSMPDCVISKEAAALNERKKAINGSKILVLGIAYKKNVDDMRESPSVFLMEKLCDLGAEISYSDPHVPVFPKMREHHFYLSSVTLTANSIAGYDCVLLATDHDKFDYVQLQQHAQLIVDSCGKCLQPAANVKKTKAMYFYKTITERKLRFALVGCGRIASNHFGAIEQHAARCELVDVCDTNPAALAAAVARTGARGHASLRELLTSSDADLVILTTPSGSHPQQAIDCFAAGFHVMTEKPMATRWRSGALGSMNVSMLIYPKNLEGSITILGEKGCVRVGSVAVNEIQHWEFAEPHAMDDEIQDASNATTSVYGFGHPLYYDNVINVMQGLAEPETDGREGPKSLELLIGMYLSADDGKRISLQQKY